MRDVGDPYAAATRSTAFCGQVPTPPSLLRAFHRPRVCELRAKATVSGVRGARRTNQLDVVDRPM